MPVMSRRSRMRARIETRRDGRRFRAVAAMILALLAAALPAHAERAPRSPAQLAAEASHIFVGRVESVSGQVVASVTAGIGNTDILFRSRIAVVAVEKGDGIAKGTEIVVRSFVANTRGIASFAGQHGHDVVPAAGERVRLFVRQAGEEYHVVYPNGVVAVEKAPLREALIATAYRRTGALTMVFGIPLSGIGITILALLGMWWLSRRRK